MNAIIMAAGMSQSFAPLAYEKPKGLMKVKGEILIERQIRQLHGAGISDITIVVGYMKEQFFYLEDKFGVVIVVNEDYFQYHNTSTLMCVLDKMDETFICSSDNYYTENVFQEKPTTATYAVEFSSGHTDEYCVSTDSSGIITSVSSDGGFNSWYMVGYAYFDHAFSTKFKAILQKEYKEDPQVKFHIWEDLYISHIEELPMRLRKYSSGTILEFDTLDQLREFDPYYVDNTDSRIFVNICKVLRCDQHDIFDIRAIKQGLTNTSFSFKIARQNDIVEEYVYRHPGIGTDEYINRESEAFSMDVAKRISLDDTFIYMDKHEGWKISKFVKNARSLDYHNREEVAKAVGMVRRLHTSNIKSPYRFGVWSKANEFIEKVRKRGRADYADFQELYDKMARLYELTKQDGVDECLCHCDCYDTNFLVDDNGKVYLIDWEYSGNDDPASDMGTFICCSDYDEQEVMQLFTMYYGHEPSQIELRHSLAYVALSSYYWYLWAIYQTMVGNTVGHYLYLWYKDTKIYWKKAMPLYGEGGMA